MWLALLSPAAIARIAELDGADDGRWQPAFLSLAVALENSRKDQTYNTPAIATLFLMADQLDWMLESGGLDWCVGRCEASAANLYGWADASDFATPFVTDEARRSPVVGTIDVDDPVLAQRRGKRGRNQLRIAMYPTIDPPDVEALTGCIDWVVENAPGVAR